MQRIIVAEGPWGPASPTELIDLKVREDLAEIKALIRGSRNPYAHSWRPIYEYPWEEEYAGPIILARNAAKRLFLVRGINYQFYQYPGVPLFYGEKQLGFTTVGDLTEFMTVPE